MTVFIGRDETRERLATALGIQPIAGGFVRGFTLVVDGDNFPELVVRYGMHDMNTPDVEQLFALVPVVRSKVQAAPKSPSSTNQEGGPL